MKTQQRITIWNGCAPSIANAIEEFSDQWGSYSAESRSHSIFSLLNRLVEPSWKNYLQSLAEDHPGRHNCIDLSLNVVARTTGFRGLENAIIEKIHAMHADIEMEFLSTLETLRELAINCRLKQPKKLSTGRVNRKYHQLCTFCGEKTELAAYDHKLKNLRYDPNGAENTAARLSAKYCYNHRPKFLDETRNPEYLRASRHKIEFNTELSRLQRQSSSMSIMRARTGDPHVDRFYMNLIVRGGIYGDEESILRNEARQLVDSKICDEKKRILMLRAEGLTFNAIAIFVGMKSRQAIEKTISSIPKAYRFDLNKISEKLPQKNRPLAFTESIVDQIKKALGNDIIDALNDNHVTESMLNPDGLLWANKTDAKMIMIGKMSVAQSTNLLHAVAKIIGTNVTPENPIVTGDLPLKGIRFSGALPPIVENPNFTMRKQRTKA